MNDLIKQMSDRGITEVTFTIEKTGVGVFAIAGDKSFTDNGADAEQACAQLIAAFDGAKDAPPAPEKSIVTSAKPS